MTLAIVGESGCGKSTFAKVLTGIEQATGGSVRLSGAEIGRTKVEARDSANEARHPDGVPESDSTLNPSHSIRLCAVARDPETPRYQRPRGPCRDRGLAGDREPADRVRGA